MHVAWYCVRGMDWRFEEAEATFIRTLHDNGIPVLLVFTQVPMRDGQYHPDAVELALRRSRPLNLPIVGGRPFMTYAMRDQFTGQPPYGLMDVLQATFHVVPEAIHGALTAAQTIDLEAKHVPQRHINATVAGAAGAAAVPIPFSSAALLVPMQLAMMGRIAHLYQVP